MRRAAEHPTQKQTLVAERYCATGDAVEAYVAAYRPTERKREKLYARAHRLLKRPAVARLIETIKAEARVQTIVSIEIVTEKAMRIHDRAFRGGQYAAATNALGLVAKINGLMIDRHEVKGEIHARVIRVPEKAPDAATWAKAIGTVPQGGRK